MIAMNPRTIAFAVLLAAFAAPALAQSGGAKGQGAVTGDPAASSANSASSTTNSGSTTTTGSSMKPSRSGSGTSTSGGSDANGDQGRDKMPDSSQGVRPLDKQHKPPT